MASFEAGSLQLPHEEFERNQGLHCPSEACYGRQPMVNVRPLTAQDAQQYHAFCQEARKRPDFFYESSGDESSDGWLDDVSAVPKSVVLGAYGSDGELAGVASVSRRTHPRWRHRATLHHVHAANKSEAITASLVDAAITFAEGLDGLRQLEVKVVMDDFRLLGAARRGGFEYCGTLPDAVRLDGCFYDQWLLIRRLAGPKAG